MGAAISVALSAPALAQTQYRVYYDPTPIPPLLILLVFAGAVLILIRTVLNAGWSSSGSTGGGCNCPECTGAHYEREAELMRKITRHQDAHTEMMRSEIGHTRTHGEFRERPDIAEHEQTLREMRNRLVRGWSQ